MPKQNTKALLAARRMPPLHHTLPGQEFDGSKSEVFNWLCLQPEIRDMVLTYLKQMGAVTFDKATGTWRGADWRPGECEHQWTDYGTLASGGQPPIAIEACVRCGVQQRKQSQPRQGT